MHRQDVGWGRRGLCHGLAAAGSAWIGDGDHNQARLTASSCSPNLPSARDGTPAAARPATAPSGAPPAVVPTTSPPR